VTTKRACLTAAALIVGVALLALAGWWRERPYPPAPMAFHTITGEPFHSGDFSGRLTLVNFWATTCSVCLREMPRLAALQERYRGRVQVLAVAMAYDPPNRVVSYANSARLPFKVAADIDGKIAGAFGTVAATPTYFLIDHSGRVTYRAVGANLDRIERKIAAALST
jgi:thiol-disulfide isomerase/thioredoxin